GSLAFANRTVERAQSVAAELGASLHPLDDLAGLIRDADIVIACVEGPSAAIDANVFDKRVIARRDRPLLVIDLSVPRAVAHELTRRLLDVALDGMKESARQTRSEEALDREYRRFLENL